ncbi:MAG: peptide-methionine (R)-S-oxide reductase MsrB [Candidatus Paceibacterota bacterium]
MKMEKIIRSDEDWRKILSPEQYAVMREKGTERPFTCELTENKGLGTYHCAACNLPLFKSNGKFESGTGWPSFYEPFSKENLIFQGDSSFGMKRVEVNCARCDSHLGHVFDDGPKPSGKRYCINGVALKFVVALPSLQKS